MSVCTICRGDLLEMCGMCDPEHRSETVCYSSACSVPHRYHKCCIDLWLGMRRRYCPLCATAWSYAVPSLKDLSSFVVTGQKCSLRDIYEILSD
jgi:hypothetical protein